MKGKTFLTRALALIVYSGCRFKNFHIILSMFEAAQHVLQLSKTNQAFIFRNLWIHISHNLPAQKHLISIMLLFQIDSLIVSCSQCFPRWLNHAMGIFEVTETLMEVMPFCLTRLWENRLPSVSIKNQHTYPRVFL